MVKSLKNKKSKTVLNAFVDIVIESNRKSNNLQVHYRREFYNKLMQEYVDKNNTLMDYIHNEGKSVITERFIEILKAKFYIKK